MDLATFMRALNLPDRKDLASRSGTTYMHLRNVAYSSKSCGEKLAVCLERETNRQVRRWELRPADWHDIWPELIGTEGAPAVPEQEARDVA